MRLWKRKLPKREDKPFKERNKIAGKVLDDKTLMTLVSLINNKRISSVDYPISTGKEAVVFRATTPKHGFVALKVFKFETSAFRHMGNYIEGDPRFKEVRHSRRSLVLEWSKKEFANLRAAREAGVSCPQPLFLRDNVIMMEFIGEEGIPYATMQEVVLSNPEKTYSEIVADMGRLYHSARLVHADLSQYNILITADEKPVIIDWGQAVLLDHPRAGEFLGNDCRNIAAYFGKDAEETLRAVKTGKGTGFSTPQTT